MSRVTTFWDWLKQRKEKKPEEYEELPLAGNAIRIVADRKLRDRLQEWDECLESLHTPIDANSTIFQYCTELIDILDLLNTMVLRIAIVYARAGDKEAEEAKHLTHGWNHLFGIYRARTVRARFFWGTNDPMTDARNQHQSINAIIIQKLHMGYENILFKYANDIVSWCFKDIDVRPEAVTVVQTMMPGMDMGGGQTITSSGTRTSEDQMQHPQTKKMPKRMPNTA